MIKHHAGVLLIASCLAATSPADDRNLVSIALGWSQNSVNAVVFRRNSLVSHEGSQYVAFYDEQARVVLAKRRLGTTDWQIEPTRYTGKVRDAHNSISLMVDGEGYLHISWDHHGNALRYARSVAPGSLQLTDKLPMTGELEGRVTYPEFYRLPDGDLLFLYRDGASGRGNLVMNHYATATKSWSRRQATLIDGEGQRNAYWQMHVDDHGAVHLSWTWRETGNMSTNHDLGYARSRDGGQTWETSTGQPQPVPITMKNAEYAARIPVGSELTNTTSMTADAAGRPLIVSYWRPEGSAAPQYHLVHNAGHGWRIEQISRRTEPFRLDGVGSRSIPISRPQVVADGHNGATRVAILFRDVERDSRVSAAVCDDLSAGVWRVTDLTDFSVRRWEPSYDTELWRTSKRLHLYVQRVGQGDGEQTEAIPPQMVSVLEWSPF